MRTAVALAVSSLAAGSLASAPPPALAGEIPEAVLVLEADPLTPGSDSTGAPPRFVLLKDNQVFVGGTRRLEAGQIDKREASELRKRAEQARKLPGVDSPVAFGGGERPWLRLKVLDGKPVEIVATGDPAVAPASLAPLATLLADLLAFDHASLRPYAPQSYALGVREAPLPGGCRAWGFPVPIEDALVGRRAVSALAASGWPTGGVPASVCQGERRYAVTLRPLLPGEQP